MSPTTPASATNTWSPPTNEIDTLLALCTDDHHSPSGTSREWEMPDVESTDDCLAMGTLPKELPGSISQDEGPRQPLAGSWDWEFDGSHSLSHEQFPTLSLPEEKLSGAAGETMVQSTLGYPVLSSIMITLEPHISFQFACHLLELYFSERSSTNAHAIYGHVPCSLLRKASFLTDDFRPTSPALLASMLWMAAVDYGHCSVSISPSQQTNICQLLRNITFWFLSVSKDGECKNVEPLLSGSFANTMARDPLNRTGDLDDVITYIHIASIMSNEQSSSSNSWWKAASDMARQLNLNEQPYPLPNTMSSDKYHCQSCHHKMSDCLQTPDCSVHGERDRSLGDMCEKMNGTHSPAYTEEHIEERRRTWWLLYIIDRHLSLRHNRPLELNDAECAGLPLPMDEISWQNGAFSKDHLHPQTRNSHELQFRDCSLFGFLLPLMKIIGAISRLSKQRSQGNHEHELEEHQVMQHIDTYQASLLAFIGSAETSDPEPKMSDAFSDTLRQTCIAYASYLIRVVRILLLGKRHWLFLVEEAEFWKSPTFLSTISHTLDGTSWLRRILHLDPDVSFMPYFFGIMLFQASFPMLLIVERLQNKCGKDILNACEVLIRATESCLVTRNTDYQRKFRQLIRSTVSQAWGRPVGASEIQRRRKSVFNFYLWTIRGTHWPIDYENCNRT
ncbi:unnamed protein product [Penicillium bialowiezense]